MVCAIDTTATVVCDSHQHSRTKERTIKDYTKLLFVSFQLENPGPLRQATAKKLGQLFNEAGRRLIQRKSTPHM